VISRPSSKSVTTRSRKFDAGAEASAAGSFTEPRGTPPARRREFVWAASAKYNRFFTMDLTLPLDNAAIERILPHRYPFLLVDRIIELEVDKRIVGIKNVSLNERYLWHRSNGPPVLPPSILTEAVAQVGAILVLVKPENRQRLPFFAGIERVRYRRPVHPGDVVVIEANVIRLRSRMGLLKGVARVNGERVIDGTMTFALGPAQQ
jgi:3-hydroxyacyl-[acyl-carrier-protein] dehydratase